MRIIFIILLFGICSVNAQNKLMYYPRLNDTYLSSKDRDYNEFIYAKKNLVAELSKISQKTFYSNYMISTSAGGHGSFTSLELVPLIQTYENFFVQGFTLKLLGDKEIHIPLTYTEGFNENQDGEISEMKSNLELSKADKIALFIPLHLLNATAGNGEYNGEFYFESIETVIKRENYASFTVDGKFSKEFYLKNRQINSLKIKTLIFEFKDNQLFVKAIYSTADESKSENIIFTTPFTL
ncbi:hypothetical protein NZ698_06855 [Chryseobacterium sp. PBS4-4]|uniref:Uncharacterized protein n=1 Tax=Chryseobacterium edaphi TaxID=2976532 RepID=A0ABT2W8B2_9FLAO|nr:hypothetical protein [Chryseobacterium edaphi]MCU7616910.1 hypothetical protein [Chryseobacterium edaphi]